MSSPRTRVYVVDDDSLLRDALVRLLAQAHCQARTFDSGSAFLRAYPNLPAGCILMDLKMPGMTGLELQGRLVEAGCRWPVIVLTGHGDDINAERAIAAGAIAFLEKPARRLELYGAIVKAEAYLTGATDVIPDPELAYRASQMTRRERDTLTGVLEKKINKEIAAELGITESSVKSYRHNVMRKMGAKTTAELVMLALRAGFRLNSRR
jgi:two-component system response regulator FixJ